MPEIWIGGSGGSNSSLHSSACWPQAYSLDLAEVVLVAGSCVVRSRELLRGDVTAVDKTVPLSLLY